MINRGCCITIVLLDILSTKHDHHWTPNTVNMLRCLQDWFLTLKFQFSIHINNFELTGDPFKLVKLYNLCSLL